MAAKKKAPVQRQVKPKPRRPNPNPRPTKKPTWEADASKIALAHLVRFLSSHDFGVIDCQMNTPHLASLGAREIPRREFAGLLDQLTAEAGPPGRWTLGLVNKPLESRP